MSHLLAPFISGPNNMTNNNNIMHIIKPIILSLIIPLIDKKVVKIIADTEIDK